MIFSNPSLQLDDIPQYSSLELRQVHPAFKKIMLIERVMIWLVLSACATVIIITKSGNAMPWWVLGSGIFLALLLVTLLFTANKSFQNMGYALRKHDLVLRKGWLFEKVHIVPLKKIQHCQVKRGPLERRYGLASLKIFTAGGDGADITLGGLRQEEAERLKDWLVMSPVEPINPITGEDAATLA
jgi:hypothetical protein